MRYKIGGGLIALAALFGLVGLIGFGTPAAAAEAPADTLTLTVDGESGTGETHTAAKSDPINLTLGYGESKTYTVHVKTSHSGGEAVNITQHNYASVNPKGLNLTGNNTEQNVTVTINPNHNMPVQNGEQEVNVAFMPQGTNGRNKTVLLSFKVTITAKEVNLTGDSPHIVYGKNPQPNEIKVAVSGGGEVTFQDLGIEQSKYNNLNAGEHKLAITSGTHGNYNIKSSEVTLVVDKAPTSIRWAKGTSLSENEALKNSQLSGSATSNGKDVPGKFEWVDPDASCGTVKRNNGGLYEDKQFSCKFIPSNENYEVSQGSATVRVMTSSNASKGHAEVKATSGTYGYDGKSHASVISTNSDGAQTLTYINEKTGEKSNVAPTKAGTYKVQATVAESNKFEAGSATAEIRISPKIVNPTAANVALTKVYDGTTAVDFDSKSVKLSDIVSGDQVSLSTTGAKLVTSGPNVNVYTASVQLAGAKLTGADAENYTLGSDMINVSVAVTKRPASVTFSGNLTKEYGETFTFGAQGNGYSIEQGSATSKSGVLPNDLKTIQLTSAGAAATASAGEYAVSALGAGANYHLSVNGNGTLKVTQATPTFVSAAAGSGQAGAKLSSVPVPTVTYVNKNSGAPIPGTVAWQNPNQTIGGASTMAAGSASYGYTFTPNDTTNYKPVNGTVEVAVTAKAPVTINATRTAFTYDGQPHEVSVSTNTEGANVSVTYNVNGSWGSTKPVNVGLYDFKIKADVPDSSQYADNEIDGKLTISPLTPTGQPKVLGNGATLSSYTLDASTITGVGGKAVSGTIAWDSPTSAVAAGEKYAWTFTSNDPNYGNATGTIIPKALANAEVVDKSALQSALITANATLASAQVSSNGEEVEPSAQWVTNTVNDVLLKAIQSANNCITEGGATQKMVDEALNNLNTAIASFKASMQAGLKGTNKAAVEKQASTVSVEKTSYNVNPGDSDIKINVGGTGNGELFAFSDNDAVASAVASGNTVSISAVSQGVAVVTVSRAATSTHEQASKSIDIVVGEAPADYVPPTEEAIDTTPPATEAAPEPIVRVYNRWSGEHLFVKESEATALENLGWKVESGAITATADTSTTPVYRLYNQWGGEHHYTTDINEYNTLESQGWKGEGVQFYSDDAKAVKVYRLWNGQDGVGSHHYTHDSTEYQTCLAIGWQNEGIGWHYVAV